MADVAFTYNPQRVVVVFGGVPLTGFDATFIKVSRITPVFSSKSGVDGVAVRSQSLDKRGTFEITLQNESPSNDVLLAAMQADETTGLGMKPLLVKDLNGRTQAQATAAWITGYADVEYSAESGARVWKGECSQLTISPAGGNA